MDVWLRYTDRNVELMSEGGYTADPKWDAWIEDWYTYAIMNELREDPSENNLLIGMQAAVPI